MNDATQRIEEARPRRFRRYPAYKDSGIKWLGEIPKGWEVGRLKDHGALVGGAGFPHDYQGTDNEVLPFYKVGDLSTSSDGRYMGQARNTVSLEIAAELRAHVIPVDSIIYAKIGAALLLNRRRITTMPCCIDNNMSAYVPRRGALASEWAFHWTTIVDFAALANPGAVPSLSEGDQVDIPIVIPPMSEQRAIAAFLDRETAKIDGLVARKERLIQLLQEKRAALITRAVTRGLDPNAPMKDSGVEWLGEIPAHWRVVPFKRAIDYVEGPGIMAADFLDEGVPLLRISGIGGRWATLEGCNYLSPEVVMRRWSHFQVRSGDLLISGSASMGFCTEVDEGTAGAIPYTGIIIIRPRAERVSKNFVRWMLLSDVLSTQVDLARSGSTIQHYGPSHLARMQVVVPPLDDQCTIAAFLDCETTRIDALISKIRQAIDHLKEFRTALISAAVTGKIDVRKEAS